MAETSGFFNSRKNELGMHDRKYNANDYNQNLAAIISNGVRRSGDNDLHVTLSGNVATIGIGRAWIEGHWYYNDSSLSMNILTAPTGDRNRQDFIVIRLNKTLQGREVKATYVRGTEVLAKNFPDPLSVIKRNDEYYDIAIASVTFVKNETAHDIRLADLRADKSLCGWITTPIGYDDYWANLDTEFHEWFSEVRNELAVKTLYKRYTDHIDVLNETNVVQFDITQYDPTGVDILDVYVNGLLNVVNVDFTLSGNNTINFKSNKIAGTEVDVYVYKSINGEGLGSVSDEITEIQNELKAMKNIGEYIYICNGLNDNIKLSEIATEFFKGNDVYKQLIISVYGNFGAQAPYAGEGTANSRYRWFSLGAGGTTKKKIIFDFSGCNEINLTCDVNKEYIGFYGANVYLKNATIIASGAKTFEMFSATQTDVKASECRFIISAQNDGFIAETGTFDNCNGHCTSEAGDSFCFKSKSLLRVNGGEYLSYSKGGTSYVIYGQIGSVSLANGVNAPVVTRTGYSQKSFYSFQDTSAIARLTNNITTLTVNTSSNATASGTISLSLPNRG